MAAQSKSSGRTEADRLKQGGLFAQLKRRPEAGSFIVMMVVIIAIGFASNGILHSGGTVLIAPGHGVTVVIETDNGQLIERV